MKKNKNFLSKTIFYFSGEILVTISGLISFPIFTRILSKSEYGLFTLINLSLIITAVIVKMGIPTALIKYYAEVINDKKKNAEKILFSTGFSLILKNSLYISALAIFIITILLIFNYIDLKLYLTLFIATLILFPRNIIEILYSVFRAKDKIAEYNINRIFIKYMPIILVLLYYKSLTIEKIFIFILITELIVVLVYIYRFRKEVFNIKLSDNIIQKNIFKYGFPLMGYEILNYLIAFSDRYIIKLYLNLSEVAIYTVGYSLAQYAYSLIEGPLNIALLPHYSKIWSSEGKQKTIEFIESSLNFLWVLIIPMILLLIGIGKELILILASSKYLDSYSIFIIIVPVLIIRISGLFFNAGFYLTGETNIFVKIGIITLVINTILNLISIKIYGIYGAAISTFITYFLMLIILKYYSNKLLLIKVNFILLLKLSFASIIAFSAIYYIVVENIFMLIVIKTIIYIILYVFVLYILGIYKYLYPKLNEIFSIIKLKSHR